MSVPRTKKRKKKNSDDWIRKEDSRKVGAQGIEEFAACILNAVHDVLGAETEDLEKILVAAEQYSIHAKKKTAITIEDIRDILYNNTQIKLTRDYYGD